MKNNNSSAQSKSHQEKLRDLEDQLWEAKRKVALLTLEVWTLRQRTEGSTDG